MEEGEAPHSWDNVATSSVSSWGDDVTCANCQKVSGDERVTTSVESSVSSVDKAHRMSSSDNNNYTHIKKPLNAFMLFMREKRTQVMAECTLRESAAINQILGRKWHALSREEQAKYYGLARAEREAHQRLYPGWSARDNYANQMKRRRRRGVVVSDDTQRADQSRSLRDAFYNHPDYCSHMFKQHPDATPSRLVEPTSAFEFCCNNWTERLTKPSMNPEARCQLPGSFPNQRSTVESYESLQDPMKQWNYPIVGCSNCSSLCGSTTQPQPFASEDNPHWKRKQPRHTGCVERNQLCGCKQTLSWKKDTVPEHRSACQPVVHQCKRDPMNQGQANGTAITGQLSRTPIPDLLQSTYPCASPFPIPFESRKSERAFDEWKKPGFSMFLPDSSEKSQDPLTSRQEVLEFRSNSELWFSSNQSTFSEHPSCTFSIGQESFKSPEHSEQPEGTMSLLHSDEFGTTDANIYRDKVG